MLSITRPTSSGGSVVTIQAVRWRGLRCGITLAGAPGGLAVDIRTRAGDADASLLDQPGEVRPDGTVSVLVPDEDYEGTAAFIVVLGPHGTTISQTHTTVGE